MGLMAQATQVECNLSMPECIVDFASQHILILTFKHQQTKYLCCVSLPVHLVFNFMKFVQEEDV